MVPQDAPVGVVKVHDFSDISQLAHDYSHN
jgi:hypothetical protein